MATAFDGEPTFWCSTAPNSNQEDRERWIMRDGKRLKEKHPQVGHVGTYDNYQRSRGIRYLRMIRHDGHETFIVLTNGAAHMDHRGSYGQYAMQKARSLGWFTMAECPCALIASRTMSRDTIHDPKVRDAQSCQADTYDAKRPCPHAVAERDFRRNERATEEREHAENLKADSTKQLEQQSKIIELLAKTVVKDEPAVEPAPPKPKKIKDGE